jgi:hypothetical protein
MSTGTIVIIVVVVVVVLAVVALVLRPQMQRRRLREKFGPEYDRTVQGADGRRDAERELAQREKRHASFDLRPLSADQRERYTLEWGNLQERFVDAPAEAVTSADRLVTELMAARGYPTEGYEQQVSDLSVEHATTLEHYRAAHDISVRHSRDEANTEDLRNAMVHYRALFEDLLRSGVEHTTDPVDETPDLGKQRDDRADVDGTDRVVAEDREAEEVQPGRPRTR